MSTIKRVPLDFDHPLNQPWPGYLMPDLLSEDPCGVCDQSGYSLRGRALHARWYGKVPFHPSETGSTVLTPDTPVVRASAEHHVATASWFYGSGEAAIVREAKRLCALWNGMWSHHLTQDDVDALITDGRLHYFTHRWVAGDGWVALDPAPEVTAAQVNEWSLHGFGHDSINAYVVIRAACEREGVAHTCEHCEGHGHTEAYPGQAADADAWEPTEPPTGDGWQRWEFISEGSPTSPVFATAEALADWLTTPASRAGAYEPVRTREEAMRIVTAGGGGNAILMHDGVVESADEYIARG